MELNFSEPFLEVLGLVVGLILAAVALALLGLVITSAVRQIPLNEIFAQWKVKGLVGVGIAALLGLVAVAIASPIAFSTAQGELIEKNYGLELTSSQLALLQWPNSAPGQTTIFGDVRLDKNVEVTLIWDDGVYRLVESASLAYVELTPTVEEHLNELEKK